MPDHTGFDLLKVHIFTSRLLSLVEPPVEEKKVVKIRR
jgi:hypothetical protein